MFPPPEYNDFHWAKLTNMLWVEQPVNTGFSEGAIRVKDEFDVGQEFIAFFKNWEDLFGIKNYKIYITVGGPAREDCFDETTDTEDFGKGESYAGLYIPYISAAMLDKKDKTYFDLSGNLLYDPCIGDCYNLQGAVPENQFAINNQLILNLNQSLLDAMAEKSESCGLNAVSVCRENVELIGSAFNHSLLPWSADRYMTTYSTSTNISNSHRQNINPPYTKSIRWFESASMCSPGSL